MDYEKKYKEAQKWIESIYQKWIESIYSKLSHEHQMEAEAVFPELRESEDEKIRETLIENFKWFCGDFPEITKWGKDDNLLVKDILAWLERQGKSSDQIHYWTEEEIEPIISDYLRGAETYGGMIGRLRCLKPKSLEKQGEKNTKQVSIWKHWKDGIAGNGESEPIYLIKNGYTYSLSPCLSYECDYIELSELDNLMLEKQGNLKSDEWKEGDVVRHGGVLALVTNGRRAIKSNLEQITIQYPNEWVKTDSKERKYFFDGLEKQGEQKPAWSEEDQKNLQGIIDEIQANKNNAPSYDIPVYEGFLNWLKSLKQRIGG